MWRRAIAIALFLGCARVVPVSIDSEVHDRPPPPPREAIPEAPRGHCPEPDARPLDVLLGPALQPGVWHPDSEPQSLGFAGSWQQRFRVKLPIHDGGVEVLGLSTPTFVSVVFLRPATDTGACILNSWTALFPDSVQSVSLEDRWVERDDRRAVLLLKVILRGEELPRWIALGVDATHVWFALEEGGRPQLAVPMVELRSSGAKLYLDVKLTRTTVFVLRESGRFERLGP